MAAKIAAEITGWEQVTGWLSKIGTPVKNPKTVLSKIAERIANEAVLEHFLNEESPSGEPWPELSPAYARRKEKAKGVSKMLHWSGDLKNSVRPAVRGNAAVVTAGGPDVPYAITHNNGWPERNIPERRFLGVGEAELTIIRQELSRWIRDFG